MAYCPDCKTEFLPEHKFCGVCGADLVSVPNQILLPTQSDSVLPYYISVNKIISMAFLSNGLYLFYWFYITWKQYHETTDETVYPVWHALSLIIPIYNLFRIHKPVRTFKTLMSDRNLPNLATVSSHGHLDTHFLAECLHVCLLPWQLILQQHRC